jgi:phosphoribosylanthranilate isomerase
MTRIKICGIRTVNDAIFCAEVGADGVGLVFADSSRQVDPVLARQISAALPPFVMRIGVFVDTEKDVVERISRYCGLTALQFHGSEDPDYCRSFSLPVLKAVRVCSENDLKGLDSFSVSAFVLDTYHPQLAGGTGQTFDWSLVEKSWITPVILAGGLDVNNVTEAVLRVRPYAVDVSSGVETEGVKDKNKIKAFVEAVRRCA